MKLMNIWPRSYAIPQLYSSHQKQMNKLVGPFWKNGHAFFLSNFQKWPNKFFRICKKTTSQHNAAKHEFIWINLWLKTFYHFWVKGFKHFFYSKYIEPVEQKKCPKMPKCLNVKNATLHAANKVTTIIIYPLQNI